MTTLVEVGETARDRAEFCRGFKTGAAVFLHDDGIVAHSTYRNTPREPCAPARTNRDRRGCAPLSGRQPAPGQKHRWRKVRVWAQTGRFASEPEAVAPDCALRFEPPPNSRPSMVCLCRASCFRRLLSSYRCCRSSRRLRRLITGRRHTGTATAFFPAITRHRITVFPLTPRKP